MNSQTSKKMNPEARKVHITLGNGDVKSLTTDIIFDRVDLGYYDREVTPSIFSNFKRVFYKTQRIFSAQEIADYILVVSQLLPGRSPRETHDLFRLDQLCDKLSVKGVVFVLEQIVELFDGLYPYPSSIFYLLGKLPRYPGHRELYSFPMVEAEYRNRLETETDKDVRYAIQEYLDYF